jgi:hypothetical protein
MADNDARSREDEYFWRRDQELIEKMRRAAAADQTNRALASKAGLTDPATIEELAQLGFTVDTVDLLPLMPLIQMAWAEGGVSQAERQLIVNLARSRGISEGTPADVQLAAWLTAAPPADVFTRSTRLIRAMLASPTAGAAALTPEALVKYCEEIAAASGGVLGMRKISAEERGLLSRIAAELTSKGA